MSAWVIIAACVVGMVGGAALAWSYARGIREGDLPEPITPPVPGEAAIDQTLEDRPKHPSQADIDALLADIHRKGSKP